MTLTNAGDVTAEVTGFSVAFYSGGGETGSANAGPFDAFTTPRQSLARAATTTVMDAGQTGESTLRRRNRAAVASRS